MEEFIPTIQEIIQILIIIGFFYIASILHAILVVLKNIRRIYANKNEIGISKD